MAEVDVVGECWLLENADGVLGELRPLEAEARGPPEGRQVVQMRAPPHPGLHQGHLGLADDLDAAEGLEDAVGGGSSWHAVDAAPGSCYAEGPALNISAV